MAMQMTKANPATNAPARARRSRAFTLVEIMIVVVIIGITVGVGVPAFVRMFDKNSLQQAESDLLSLCATARLMAITEGRPVDLVVRLVERSFVLAPVEVAEPRPAEEDVATLPKASPETAAFFLPRDVQFAVTAGSQAFENEREVRVRFFPGATCEELTVMLESNYGRRRLVLEVTTALVDVQNPD